MTTKNGLVMSDRLKKAIEVLAQQQDYKRVAAERGAIAAHAAIVRLLRETRPEVFDMNNSGDGLAWMLSE